MDEYIIYDAVYNDYVVLNNHGPYTYTYTDIPERATKLNKNRALDFLKQNSSPRWTMMTVNEAFIQNVMNS